jgi:hypothetical protein
MNMVALKTRPRAAAIYSRPGLIIGDEESLSQKEAEISTSSQPLTNPRHEMACQQRAAGETEVAAMAGFAPHDGMPRSPSSALRSRRG